MNTSQVMDGKKKKRNKISVSKEDLECSSLPLSVDDRPISKAGPLEFDELLERELAKGMPQDQAQPPQPSRRESSASKATFLKRGERAAAPKAQRGRAGMVISCRIPHPGEDGAPDTSSPSSWQEPGQDRAKQRRRSAAASEDQPAPRWPMSRKTTKTTPPPPQVCPATNQIPLLAPIFAEP
jgi:hypothetical protein